MCSRGRCRGRHSLSAPVGRTTTHTCLQSACRELIDTFLDAVSHLRTPGAPVGASGEQNGFESFVLPPQRSLARESNVEPSRWGPCDRAALGLALAAYAARVECRSCAPGPVLRKFSDPRGVWASRPWQESPVANSAGPARLRRRLSPQIARRLPRLLSSGLCR